MGHLGEHLVAGGAKVPDFQMSAVLPRPYGTRT